MVGKEMSVGIGGGGIIGLIIGFAVLLVILLE